MSKIKRSSIEIDPCSTSISILRNKCEIFFNNQNKIKSTCRIYIDDQFEQRIGSFSDDIVDFILFGNAYKKIFESGNWIGRKVRIWVLSKSNKEIIEYFFNGQIEVNLIPRYQLYPKSDNLIPFYAGEEYDFIFAGRLSAQKNIEALIFFLHNYNEKYDKKCTLRLFGDFENTYHEDLGRRVHHSYKEKIYNLVYELNLNDSVFFEKKVESSEWIRLCTDKSVFISLSTFISEDFGCSVAEAQERGWPCILSDYGGHRDVYGNNVIKIPPSYICNSHFPLKLQEIVSKKLVNLINNDLIIENESIVSEVTNNSALLTDIDRARREFVSKIGPTISLLHREYVCSFADTTEGSLFFYNLKNKLKKKRPLYTVILFDLDNNTMSSEEESALEGIFSQIDLSRYDVEFISSKSLFFKDSINILLLSEKIFVIKDKINVTKLKDFFLDKLLLDPRCIQYE